MNELLTFTIISLLLVISPGPNSVLILKTVSGRGFRSGVENIIGLVTATFVHGAISILGLSAIILQSAELFMLIKIAGAAYLFYLGAKTIYATFIRKEKLATVEAVEAPKKQVRYFYQNVAEGFFTQILNPKVSMFYIAAFPQFVDFGSSNHLAAFVLVSIHASIIFTWFLGMSIFISKVKSIAGKSRLGVWVQRVSGGALIFFSGLIITQEAAK
ncbi:LysE family translocator [Leucothrix sargassi]|nr:LysE family translocator [Leucothrix sargassi]